MNVADADNNLPKLKAVPKLDISVVLKQLAFGVENTNEVLRINVD